MTVPSVRARQGARLAPRSLRSWALELILLIRGIAFVGSRHSCPCCGWRFRGFSAGGSSLKTRPSGHCPRCRAKARHRRIWLFLKERTNLFIDSLRLLEVSPAFSFSRQWVKATNLMFVGADLSRGPHISVRMDLTAGCFAPDAFDAIICVHVLEEIADDRRAMQELFRMLRPGGWALVSVPTRMDRETYEDWTITRPKDRRHAFGEEAHVRIYGQDLVQRLQGCGFEVEVDLATDVVPAIREAHGLRDDENIFFCTKP
jgi:SAM-dependent methyltransferase